MSEREQIVAWLRKRADRHMARKRANDADVQMHYTTANALLEAATAIERGNHLRERK